MEQYDNQKTLLSIIALMDTLERLEAQRVKFESMTDIDPTRKTLLAASDFVMHQIHDFLEAGLQKAKKDKEVHAKAEEAGIIIQAGVGNGILLPGQRRN